MILDIKDSSLYLSSIHLHKLLDTTKIILYFDIYILFKYELVATTIII